jgi:hypothetical protein
MSYDPSRRALPPRQGGWPQATPPRAWPAYRDDSAYQDADQAAAEDEATGEGSYWADASSQRQPAYQSESAYQRELAYQSHSAYQGTAAYQAQPGYQAQPAYEPDPAYRGTADYQGRPAYQGQPAYGAALDYQVQPGYQDAFDGSGDREYRDYGPTRVIESLRAAPDGYAYGRGGVATDGFDGAGYGYDGAEDGYEFDAGGAAADDDRDRDRDYYAEPRPSGPMLMAPDAGMLPHHWQVDRDRRQERRRRGVMAGAVTGFLAAAVTIGVTNLAAAVVRPPVSPVVAVGNVFIDRAPAALKNPMAAHFGPHGRTVLLLGIYVIIALLAMALGVLTRRAPALGVAGVAAGAVVAAFVTITRAQAGPEDAIPWVIGGIAGVAALLWLVRSSAPAAPVRPGRRGNRRRAR